MKRAIKQSIIVAGRKLYNSAIKINYNKLGVFISVLICMVVFSPCSKLVEEKYAEFVEWRRVAQIESEIPTEVENLSAPNGEPYYIKKLDDWLAVQELSKHSSLEGYEFSVSVNSTDPEHQIETWDITTLTDFKGIGSAEFPFKGKLTSPIANGRSITTNVPLFKYLSAEAELTNIKVIASGATSGIADVLIGSGTLECANIGVSGNSILNSSGVAGGLFASIINSSTETPLTINIGCNLYTNVTSVSGTSAGLFAASVKGNVDINVDTSALDNLQVNVTGVSPGGYCGGLFGYIDGTININNSDSVDSSVDIVLSGNLDNEFNILGKGDLGGIVGYCKASSITAINDGTNQTVSTIGLDANVSTINCTSNGGNVGAISGKAVYSDISYINVCNFNITTVGGNALKGFAGGAIGMVDSLTGHTVSSINNISVEKTNVSSGTGYAGGVIGYSNNDTDEIQNIDTLSNTYYYNNKLIFEGFGAVGGVVGCIKGNTYKLKNCNVYKGELNTTNEVMICKYNTNIASYMAYGGIVGAVDAECEISDSDVNFEYMKKYGSGNKNSHIGGIIGCIIKSQDDNVRKIRFVGENKVYGNLNTTNRYDCKNSQGGVIGNAGDNVLITIDGQLDISGLAYPRFKSSNNYSYVSAEYLGKIIGRIGKSLAYLEEGASIVYPENNNDKMYKANDIGDNSAVIRNGHWDGAESAKLIENNAITGTVDTENGAYQINSTGDLVRLAIVLNTCGQFGLSAFGEGATYESVRQASFIINQNINLTDTGVLTLNRNANAQNELITNADDFAFKGTIQGSSNDISITNTLKAYTQGNMGLFSCLSDATVKDITLNMDIESDHVTSDNTDYSTDRCMNAGGIAAYAKGNINISNINAVIKINVISNSAVVNNKFYYGGVFGCYYGTNSSTLEIKNSNFSVELEDEKKDHYVAGLIGYYSAKDINTTVNISGVKIGGNIIAGDNNGSGGISYIDSTLSNKVNINIQKNSSDYGLKIDGLSISSSAVTAGGLLGKDWNNVNANLNDIVVDGESSLTLTGRFGGLITNATGRMILNRVSINKLTVADNGNSDTDSENAKCGLLIRDASKLYLTVCDYFIDSSNVSVNYYGTTFDEIAGFNKIENTALSGGITTISYSDTKALDTTGTYKSYENQECTSATNNNTRYYYDIDSILETCIANKLTKSGASWIIENEEQLMMWHIVNYADNDLKSYFKTAYNSYDTGTKYKLTADLNMKGYSIYPTDVEAFEFNGDGHSITFDAKLIDEKEVTNKRPYDNTNQHYRLHAGLFGNISGASEVTNIELSGSVTSYINSNNIYNSGALVSGAVSKNISISNVELNNLWIVNPSDSWSAPMGLMVNAIKTGVKADFDMITMNSYDTVNNTGKAASALIGQVGDDKATNIKLTFTNMDLASLTTAANDSLSVDGAAAKVLACASFIYSFNYTGDGSNGLYTFTKNDYLYGEGKLTGTLPDGTSGLVTLGYELGDNTGTISVEYNDSSEKVGSGYSLNNTNYIPYVYNHDVKNINVNPKTGDILEGCGTYEDPYKITSAKQLITLSNYINGMDKSLYDQWKINKLGNDDSLCSGVHNQEDIVTYDASMSQTTLESSGFPSLKGLACAYYMIMSDIDMTEYSTYIGIGTDINPFNGVIVGNEYANNTYPTITLPTKAAASSDDNFGFIKRAKGTVLKNLNFRLSNGNNIAINKSGSPLIDTIMGGDNIVDNVKVTGTIYAGTKTAYIGGYVGTVERGGLILRNMSSDLLNSFAIGRSYVDDVIVVDAPNLCGMIGNVLDGFVVYDDDSDTTKPLAKNIAGFYGNAASLNTSKSYDVINAGYLSSNGKLDVTYNDKNGFSFAIDNAAQMQVYSMALNSGVLSYHSDTATTLGYAIGYNGESVCRNSDYDYVGNVDSDVLHASNISYVDAISNDNLGSKNVGNNMYGTFKPYMYDFFEFGEGVNKVIDGTSSRYGLLNNDTITESYMDNIVLANKNTYDMTIYEKGFLGLGSRYVYNKTAFRANLYGNGSTVKIGMLYDSSSKSAGAAFINNYYASNSEETIYTIKDINVTGYVINGEELNVNSEITMEGNKESTGRSAAMLINYVNARCKFENVCIQNPMVRSLEYAAGYVGKMDNSNAVCRFTNCSIVGSNKDTDNIMGICDTGGFVAYAENGELQFTECEVSDVGVLSFGNGGGAGSSINWNWKDSKESDVKMISYKGNMKESVTSSDKHFQNAAGLVAYAWNLKTTLKIERCKYNTIDIEAFGSAGGYVGEIKNKKLSGQILYIDGTSGEPCGINSRIKSHCIYFTYKSSGMSSNAGGIVGKINERIKEKNTSYINNVYINNIECTYDYATSDVAYCGGIVGAASGTVTIENSYVGAKDVSNIFIGTKNYFQQSEDSYNGHAGGIVGGSNTTDGAIKITLSVNNTVIGGENGTHSIEIGGGNTAGGVSGSIIGSKANINKFSIFNAHLKSKKSTGGVIGISDVANPSVKEILISKCNIECFYPGDYKNNSAAGGIIGKLKNALSVENVHVLDSFIQGNQYAGGLVAFLTGGNALIDVSYFNETINCIQNCCILAGEDCGGVVGKNENGNNNNKINEIILEDNKIIGLSKNNSFKRYVGGVIGYSNRSFNIQNIQMNKNIVAVYLYKEEPESYLGGVQGYCTGNNNFISNVKLYNNCVSYMYSDNIANALNNDNSTKKVYTDILSKLSNEDMEPYMYYTNTKNKLSSISKDSLYSKWKTYSHRVGELFGYTDRSNSQETTNHIYAYNVDIDIPNENIEKGYRPLTDVGWNTTDNESDMYAYRSNVHIVYGNYNSTDNVANNTIISDTIADAQYEFASLKSIWNEFKLPANNSLSTYRLDQDYANNLIPDDTSDMSNVMNGTFYDYDEEKYVSYFIDSTGDDAKPIPMIVLKSEYGSVNNIINKVINILTNNGGSLDSIGNIGATLSNPGSSTEVTTKKAILSYTEGQAVITTNNDTPSISYVNGAFAKNHFDTYESDGTGTFTIVSIKYIWKYKNVEYSYILNIPVFMESMLGVNANLRYSDGFEYSVDTIRSNSKYYNTSNQSTSVLTKGSEYTIFAEYVYDAQRENYSDVYINKQLYYESEGVRQKLIKGTKLTLVDITDGNKTYYYTVNEDNITAVQFTDFVDSAGNVYNINDIRESSYKNNEEYTTLSGDLMEDVTYERFLIYVDRTQVAEEEIDEQVYNVHVSMDNTNGSMRRRVEYNEKSYVRLKELAGTTEKIDIEGVDSNGNKLTSISGNIAENSSVDANIKIDVTASSTYWSETTNSNTNQYLELALSLKNNSGNVIGIPEGTKITYTYDSDDEYKYANDVVYLYYYHDNDQRFSIDNLNGNYSKVVSIKFDFSTADLSNIESGNYSICAELIKTKNPDFPRSGIVKSAFSSGVSAESDKEIGFAVETDELMNLGINLINNEESDSGVIDFYTKIDFEDYIRHNLASDISKVVDNRKYRMSFSIEKKIKDNNILSYAPLTDDEKQNFKIFYEDMDITNDGDILTVTEELIRQGYAANDERTVSAGIVEKGYTLKVNRAGLDELKDLTNYRIIVTMDVLDTSVGEENPTIPITLTDYFILTAAKIKTDL